MVFPAYAGVFPFQSGLQHFFTSLPRIRGGVSSTDKIDLSDY